MSKLLSNWPLLSLFILLSNISLEAQRLRGNYNYSSFEQKPYYFGITLGYNSSHLKLSHSNEFVLNEAYSVAESLPNPGMSLGIVTNLKVGKYFDFRFLPTLIISRKSLSFEAINPDQNSFVESTDAIIFETPFHLRYKSKVYQDKRAFVIAGLKYGYDMGSNVGKRNADELVKISPTDFSAEFGAGVQFFLPYFIFSPEIKFSHGLGNSLIYDGNLLHSNVIEKLKTRMFTISLHFEG